MRTMLLLTLVGTSVELKRKISPAYTPNVSRMVSEKTKRGENRGREDTIVRIMQWVDAGLPRSQHATREQQTKPSAGRL